MTIHRIHRPFRIGRCRLRTGLRMTRVLLAALVGIAVAAASQGQVLEPATNPDSTLSEQDEATVPIGMERDSPPEYGSSDIVPDPALSDDVPNYFYLTHFSDHAFHQNDLGVDVELVAWNGANHSTWVRVKGGDDLHDFELEAGSTTSLLRYGGPFNPEIPLSAHWFTIASDTPLQIFGAVHYNDGYGYVDSGNGVAQAEAGKRTLDIREIDCVKSPWICQRMVDTVPWPTD